MHVPIDFQLQEPRLETERTPSHLLFRCIPRHGARRFRVLVGIVMIAAVYAVLHPAIFVEKPGWVALFTLVLSCALFRTRHPRMAELEVSREQIVARRGIRGWVVAVLPRTTEMVYVPGGKYGAPGLYADRGWGRTLLLPDVSEAQCANIMATVRGTFPDTPAGRKQSRVHSLQLSR